MGMFDNIVCEHPLPDGFKPTIPFQTKDLCNELTTFTITVDGKLVDDKGKEVEDYHADLHFYNSNVCASGPDGFATTNDDKLWSKSYIARFNNGRLQRITGGDDGRMPLEKHITKAELDKKWNDHHGH